PSTPASGGRASRLTANVGSLACALTAVALMVAYFLVPSGSNAKSVIYEVLSVGTPVAIVGGIFKYRPERPLHWWLLAGAIALWAAGDTYWDAYRWFTGGQAPYPSPADVAYLGAYPL